MSGGSLKQRNLVVSFRDNSGGEIMLRFVTALTLLISAHAAESKFSQALQTVKRKLGLKMVKARNADRY